MKKSPSEVAARTWAEGYLNWLCREHDGILTRERGPWYRKEMLREQLLSSQNVVNGQLAEIPAGVLRCLARTDPAAHDLLVEIIEDGQEPGMASPMAWHGLADQIDAGAFPRPKRQGRTGAENGLRDLIFKLMAAHMVETFGLHFSRNDETTRSPLYASACEIISDVFRERGLHVPAVRSIERAIARCDDINITELIQEQP